jgi:hypothetical protein
MIDYMTLPQQRATQAIPLNDGFGHGTANYFM